MTKKNRKFFKILWFLKRIISPIALALFLFWLYVKCFCFFSSKYSSADLVCYISWKDGLILIISYSIVKLLSSLFDWDTIFKRFILTLLLYSLSFAIIAFPFWIASFFQDFVANTFIHISAMILAVDFTFERYNRVTET